MSLEGTVKKWDEDRSYGFIIPAGGGDDVFVHRNELVGQKGDTPLMLDVGQAVTYDGEVQSNGKTRAKNVQGPGVKARTFQPGMQFGAAGCPPGHQEGTVKRWEDEKGFGFIEIAGQKEHVFVMRHAIGPRAALMEDQPVYFTPEPNPKNPSKTMAANVTGPAVMLNGKGKGRFGWGGGGWAGGGGGAWGGAWGGGQQWQGAASDPYGSQQAGQTWSGPSALPPTPAPVAADGTPATGAAAGGWKPAQDPNTGNTYYFHTVTNQTTWDMPPEVAAAQAAGSAAAPAAAAPAAAAPAAATEAAPEKTD